MKNSWLRINKFIAVVSRSRVVYISKTLNFTAFSCILNCFHRPNIVSDAFDLRFKIDSNFYCDVTNTAPGHPG